MFGLRIQTSLLHGFSWIFMDFEGFAALTQHDLSCIQLSHGIPMDPGIQSRSPPPPCWMKSWGNGPTAGIIPAASVMARRWPAAPWTTSGPRDIGCSEMLKHGESMRTAGSFIEFPRSQWGRSEVRACFFCLGRDFRHASRHAVEYLRGDVDGLWWINVPRTELWKKVSRNMPTPEEGARMDLSLKLPWVQSWEIPGGLAIYNHLTAAVKLELSSLSLWRLVGGCWWGCCWPAFGDLWGAREFTPFLRAEQNCTSAIDPLWVFAFGEVNRCMWPLGEEKDLW